MGNIERDGNGPRWTNLAGVRWSLAPSGKYRLETGHNNPYFNDGRSAFDLIVPNGLVTGLLFGDEVYTKVQTALPMNRAGMDAIALQNIIDNTDGGRNVAVFSIDGSPGQSMTVNATSPNNHAGFVIYDADSMVRNFRARARRTTRIVGRVSSQAPGIMSLRSHRMEAGLTSNAL